MSPAVEFIAAVSQTNDIDKHFNRHIYAVYWHILCRAAIASLFHLVTINNQGAEADLHQYPSCNFDSLEVIPYLNVFLIKLL